MRVEEKKKTEISCREREDIPDTQEDRGRKRQKHVKKDGEAIKSGVNKS